MNLETISFTKSHTYNTLQTGITIPVTLQTGFESVDFEAKVDTGASFCVFERKHGERLGLDIESGTPQRFGTVTGGFLAYGHRLGISVLEIEFEATVFFAAEEFFVRNVLGQTGWLDRVKLGLLDQEGKLFLSDCNE